MLRALATPLAGCGSRARAAPLRKMPAAAVATAVLAAVVAAAAIDPGAFLPAQRTSEAGQQVQCSSVARFTVLTPRVIRAEYVTVDGTSFEDEPTQTFLFRGRQPPAPFTVANTTDWCNITTSELVLSFFKPGVPSPPMPAVTTAAAAAAACPQHLYPGFDAVCDGHCTRDARHQAPVPAATVEACCAACDADSDACGAFVFHGKGDAGANCFLLSPNTTVGRRHADAAITLGSKADVPAPSPGPGPAPPPPPSPQPSGAGAFAKHLLQARSVRPGGWAWRVTDSPEAGNLRGTLYPTPSADLAGCCDNPNASSGQYDPKYPLDLGLVSTSGWAVVDDSAAPLMRWDATSRRVEDAWISTAPRTGNVDVYLFGCGSRFRQCLTDFTSVAGPVAFPPLFGVGVWWSRHWGDDSGNKAMVDAVGPMTDRALTTQVAEGYLNHSLPLHVVVADMEWHEMNTPASGCKTFAGKSEWGGYTWNSTLFPDPEAFVASLHAAGGPTGIRLALNFHPDSGIDVCQANHDVMARALGMDPTKPLPDIDGAESLNETYVDAYFKYMIEATHVDVPWTDTPKATTWTNWLYVRYPMKKGNRTINFSRYGGLGNHRTPTGFSGDTARKWSTLEYEIWMTPRAANVGFGWWSHDIGGFAGGFVDSDWHTESPELFLRWLQFGALSPVTRTHCRYCDQRPWTWSRYNTPRANWLDLLGDAMRLRNALVPYIYSHAALRTHLLGESLLTPMYWDETLAARPQAYAPEFGRQYFFGAELLAAPISDAVDNATGMAMRTVWLPSTGNGGGWLDFATMKPVKTDDADRVTKGYALGDIPLFVRAGAVLPTRTMASTYLAVANPLVWLVAPGAAAGNGTVYEDDGDSMQFRNAGLFQTTTLAYATASGVTTMTLATSGSAEFGGAPAARDQWIALRGVVKAPASATCDGKSLKLGGVGQSPGFWLDPDSGGNLVVACGGATSFSGGHTVVVRH